ncbi:MAG TPA: amino acid permease, partial [bacterium]|nr:amino acid permease [bacterium]
VIYTAVALVLLLHVPREAIGESKTPLLLVFDAVGWNKVPQYFAFVAILAIANTGLVNLIMASRLMYGMSEEKLLPPTFGRVHARRSTPWISVLAAGGIVLLLVFTGSLKALAQTTSLLILGVFFFVHLSLLKIKKRKEPHEGIVVPWICPILGALSCLALVFTFPAEVFLRSGVLLALGFLVWLVQRR